MDCFDGKKMIVVGGDLQTTKINPAILLTLTMGGKPGIFPKPRLTVTVAVLFISMKKHWFAAVHKRVDISYDGGINWQLIQLKVFM